ncbi:ATP-dependent zinc metalloprotease FtsH [Methanocorpusculaceae archaeon Sp1]|nr:ATP-dependent zinc metalloprotease FtsH [Methanocorpusculaceae archaeon Sp1]
MDATATDSGLLQLTEIVLTAEVVNGNSALGVNDLPVSLRPLFCPDAPGVIARPVAIKEGQLKTYFPALAARSLIANGKNSYLVVNDLGQFAVTTFAPAMKWYLRNAGAEAVMKNPALALSFETSGESGISYKIARENIPLFEDTVASLSGKIGALTAKSESFREAADLVVAYAPEEIEFSLEDLVCTSDQMAIVRKVQISLENQEFLRRHRIYELGRILLVGPPGTGKTSFALALSRSVHMPVLEVRLSMLTSQYLGETSKNIDRIFDLAKKIAPCILFIDEFDYIAKTRISDDNGTMKRAVNTLLKSIDHINLIKDQVLLIGATNHAGMLDDAAWRRFDEVVTFTLPDVSMREAILRHVATDIPCTMDFATIAEQTEGFSGADLRMMLTEAIVSALLAGRKEINETDVNAGMELVNRRNIARAGCT